MATKQFIGHFLTSVLFAVVAAVTLSLLINRFIFAGAIPHFNTFALMVISIIPLLFIVMVLLFIKKRRN